MELDKCIKVYTKLISSASNMSPTAVNNLCNSIQELVDANIGPIEFCDRSDKLLNNSAEPLLGLVKESLPILRQALHSRELVIAGIRPPSQIVNALTTIQQLFPNIQTEFSPINKAITMGQIQVRVISPATAGVSVTGGARPFDHTTITKQQGNSLSSGIRIQGPNNTPRLVNAQIRPISTEMQHQQSVQSMTVSQLQRSPKNKKNNDHYPIPATTKYTQSAKKVTKAKKKIMRKKEKLIILESVKDIKFRIVLPEKEPLEKDRDDRSSLAAMGEVNLAEETQRILRRKTLARKYAPARMRCASVCLQ